MPDSTLKVTLVANKAATVALREHARTIRAARDAATEHRAELDAVVDTFKALCRSLRIGLDREELVDGILDRGVEVVAAEVDVAPAAGADDLKPAP